METRSIAAQAEHVASLRSAVKGYTLQDSVALGLPYLTLSAYFVICPCLALHPKLKLLLYSGLNPRCQSPLVFVVCLAEDLRFVAMTAAIGTPSLQVQVIAFDGLIFKLKEITEVARTR